MTEQELAAIEKRANAATREPWIVSGTYVPTASLSAVSVYGMGMEVAECQMDTDGTFIAAARVDVPALIAEVRKLTAERDALRVDAAAMLITIKDAAWLLLNARGTEYLAMVEASYKLTEHMERLTAALHPLEEEV